MSKPFKICIVGNSVALRTRPVQPHPENINYGSLLVGFSTLEGRNVTVENRSAGAYTVRNVYRNIDNIVNSFPDVYIINLGVVDACNREVPLWFYRLATRKSESLQALLFRFLYRKIIAKVRPLLVILRGRRSWVSVRGFERYLRKIAQTLIKETNARLLFISINPADSRVEASLPGSREKQLRYNQIIQSVSEEFGQLYCDTTDMEASIHFPDGVHYSLEGHRLLTDKLKSVLQPVVRFKE